VHQTGIQKMKTMKRAMLKKISRKLKKTKKKREEENQRRNCRSIRRRRKKKKKKLVGGHALGGRKEKYERKW